MPASAAKFMACDADEHYRSGSVDNASADDAAFGTIIGGVASLAAGALTAVGALGAPGLEPLVAMGVLAASTALGTGGALNGCLGGFSTHFIYAKSAEPGSGTMITVRADSERAAFVEANLRRGLAVSRSE